MIHVATLFQYPAVEHIGIRTHFSAVCLQIHKVFKAILYTSYSVLKQTLDQKSVMSSSLFLVPHIQ